MNNWTVDSIIFTIILLIVIIGVCVYIFAFRENITETEAQRIAYEYAGVNKNDVTILSIRKDGENRKYEIRFYDDIYAYKVDINYNNGEIRKFEKDLNNNINQNSTLTNTGNGTNTENNLATNNIDNNTTVNNTNNSNILNNSNNTNTTNNQYIGTEKARVIALEHAGLTDNNVTFGKSELDVDYNISKYEIEFYYNNYEYDYEINAVTGEILKYERERERK